ncbi:MAG: nucleotidyl transferase AbiEii/AbiGii toxin family protein [Clostridiales bacterium]|jgi:predicted nucleotidyltransferase component of viral defense system|nr:nucleotidyl transferase AbiEii/AbiGii toxin family protein [Clostridiales bacterium]
MKLHSEQELFKALILQTERTSGLSSDILEKDYYVTLTLNELSLMQDDIKAYFKGGTALYKAIRHIKRFSEDIDLTVDVAGLSNNQARKRLERAVYGYSLALDKQDGAFSEKRGSITAVYRYESAFFDDSREELQRYERVLVEATSFTVSEPVTSYEIAPLIYDLTTSENKKILSQQFGVAPFNIRTIRLERIFIDKIFAAEFYYIRNDWFDAAKHVYDIAVLSERESVKQLFSDGEKLDYMISLKRKEEEVRKGGISADLRIKDFSYFDGIEGNSEFKEAYQNMQSKYVLNKADYIEIAEALRIIRELREKL